MKLFHITSDLLVTYLVVRVVLWLIIHILLKHGLYFLHYLLCCFESLLDQGIQIQLRFRYYKFSHVRCFWLMKLKYRCRTSSHRLLYLWASIREPNKVSLFHLLLILLTVYLVFPVFISSAVSLGYRHIKQIDFEPYKETVIMVIFITAAYMAYQYVLFRMKYSGVVKDIYGELQTIVHQIHKNIDAMDSYSVNNLLNNLADEITDWTGYTYQERKLIRQKNTAASTALSLSPVFQPYLEIVQKLRDIQTGNKAISFLKVPDSLVGFSFEARKERRLFRSLEGEGYQDIINYFRKGHIQIHAKLYTELRIIRKDRLGLLKHWEEQAGNELARLENCLEEYQLENCMLEYHLTAYLRYLNRVFISENLIGDFFYFAAYVIQRYLKSIWILIY